MLCVGSAFQSAKAQTFFTDRSAFQSAAGLLSTESFETAFGSVQPTFTFTDFSFSAMEGSSPTGAVARASLVPGFLGFGITNGVDALGYRDNGSSTGRFLFNSPIYAFGVDVGSNARGLLTIGGDLASGVELESLRPKFFGVIWTAGFDQIDLDMAGAYIDVAVDFVQYSPSVTVPEPSSFALVALGGLAVLFGRRRRA